MSRTVYRITRKRYQDTAFDGEGARRYPGRWNSRGTPMVYTASSRSLAILEILVNYEAEELLMRDYVVIPATIPEALILTAANLPKDWSVSPIAPASREFGDAWVSGQDSAALSVPSTVVPEEDNILLNPGHPEFHKIVIGEATELTVDPRLTDR